MNKQHMWPDAASKISYSNELKDLVDKLLTKDPSERIGSAEEILAHPWFKNIDIEKLKEKKLKPPFDLSFKYQEDLGEVL